MPSLHKYLVPDVPSFQIHSTGKEEREGTIAFALSLDSHLQQNQFATSKNLSPLLFAFVAHGQGLCDRCEVSLAVSWEEEAG